MRFAFSLPTAATAAVLSFTGIAIANDPCPTCAKGVTPTLAPKPKCDNRVYPLVEQHYYNRYCGPVISPNATYGYFQPQWRAWDGGTTAGCSAPAAETAAAATQPTADPGKLPAPAAIPNVKPEDKPPVKPVEVKPTDVKPMVPPAGSGKESIPAPKPAGKGLLKRFGTAAPVSPGVYLVPVNQ